MKEFTKKIDKINFGLMSPEDIRKMSVVRVETPDTYDSDGYPIENGLMDPRMGVLDPSLRCHTCGVRGGDCQGHFGSIELARPVIHVGFGDIIHKILRSTCNECGRVLLPEDVLEDYREKIMDALNHKESLEDILKKIQNESKKVEMNEAKQNDIVGKILDDLYPEDADYDEIERDDILLNILNQLYTEAYMIRDETEEKHLYKYIDPKMLCPHCRKNQTLADIESKYEILKNQNLEEINKIKEDIRSNIGSGNEYEFDIEFKRSITSFITSYIQNLVQEPIILDMPTTFSQGYYKLTASEIRARLERITDEDIFVLGINPEVARPEWLVLTVLPVPPVTVRPSITLDTGERSEDDLTHKLVDVLRINQRLVENMEAGAPQLIVEDLWDLLQYHVTTYFDNEANGVPPSKHRSGRPFVTLLQRLKGKDGRFRSNLSGKRVNFSARSVLAPDPKIGINEVGIPEIIAKEITVPVHVNELNINQMKKYIENGSAVHPGANFIITEFGSRRKINNQTKEFILENLKPGDIIERHLNDGDIVLFNRQPSLHKFSVLAHEVKIHHNNTININPLLIPPFDANFGGDEANIHVLQNVEAEAEAKSLMLAEKNMISPRYGGPIIGAINDYISGAFLLTRNSSKFSEEEALQVLRKSCIKIPPFKDGKWILKYDDKYSEESFIYKEKGEYWTGKELFSLLLPNDLNLQFDSKINKNSKKFNDESYVRIEEGILKTGIIDENAIGAFSGHLLNKMIKEYGFKEARIFLEKTSLISIAVFMKTGITNSLNDYEIPVDAKNKINDYLNECELKIYRLIEAYNEGILNCLPSKTLEETLETRIMQVLSLARDYAGEICEPYFDVNNQNFPFSTMGRNSAIMARTGAISSSLNLTQITACVGQQSIRGGRIFRGYIDRTLPHFRRNDYSAEAHGFIKSSFKEGLDPIEYFFHAMGGREGLVNAAIRVAQSGYMQRRLVNALIDVKSDKKGLVSDNHDNVVQILYGDDGVDPVKSDFGNPADLDRLIDEIKIKDDMDDVKISNFKNDYDKLIKLKEESDKLTKKLNRRVKHLPDTNEDLTNIMDSLDNKPKTENLEDNIVGDFKFILNNYKFKSKGDIITNDFFIETNKNVNKHLNKLLNTYAPNYHSRLNFGLGKWTKYPNIHIFDKNSFKKKDIVLLNFVFNCDNSEVCILLRPNINQKRIFNENFNKIKELFIKENVTFIYRDKKPFKDSIFLKTYKYHDLEETVIENDLKKFIELCEKINYICTDNIINDFRFILNKYESGGNNIENINLDFSQNISKKFDTILNDFTNEYTVIFKPGIKYSRIYIQIKDNIIALQYVFNCDYSDICVLFGTDSRNFVKFKENIPRIKEIFNKEFIEFNYRNNIPFKDSILLKSYAINELNQNLLIKDLKKFINLYEKISDIFKENIINDFKFILDNYETESNGNMADNDFYIDIKKNLPKHLDKLLKDFAPKYVSKVNFGLGNWAKYPKVYITDKYSYKKNNELLFNFVFNCKNSEICIILRSNIRNILQFKENLSKIEDLCIDEGINFGYGHQKPFKNSIILKTYKYDDLKENIFIKDLKKFIEVYERINNILESSPSSIVVSDFNEILDHYESEKRKELKGSEFAFKLQNQFTKDIENFVKSVLDNPKDKYSVRCSFGISSWADKPIISIINENIFDSFQEGLHINYTFDTKLSKVYLSINPRSKNNEQYLELKKLLVEELNTSNFNSQKGFIFGENDIDEYSVILKEYNKENMYEYVLNEDLKYLLPIYRSLCDVYLKNRDSIKNSVTSKKDDSNSTNILGSILNLSSNSRDIMNIKTNPYKYFNIFTYSNNINDYKILFNEENMEKLENFDFTYDDYKNILNNIEKSFEKSLTVIINENNLKNDFISLALRDKILIFVKSFSNVKYKHIGNEYGYLKFNTIYIEERTSNPIIITTMIHELAHFILTEILEQAVMKILNTNRTPLIESYICLTLQEDLWYIMDEFCAHTVEGRFTPYGYQSYASYNYKKDEVSKNNSKKEINFSLTIANTFAADIKSILESFIYQGLRDEIKEEYYNSNEERNEEGVNQEIEETLNEKGLIEAIKTILFNGAEVCKNRIDELNRCIREFEKYYGDD